MSDVTIVVHRHPAHIHADLAGHQGFKRLFASGQGIVDTQHNAQLLHRRTTLRPVGPEKIPEAHGKTQPDHQIRVMEILT